jgi:hypothetical protein
VDLPGYSGANSGRDKGHLRPGDCAVGVGESHGRSRAGRREQHRPPYRLANRRTGFDANSGIDMIQLPIFICLNVRAARCAYSGVPDIG